MTDKYASECSVYFPTIAILTLSETVQPDAWSTAPAIVDQMWKSGWFSILLNFNLSLMTVCMPKKREKRVKVR